jgi:DNA damage-binding protein 1
MCGFALCCTNPCATGLQGRIIILRVQGGKVLNVAVRETRGACYNITAFQGKLLAGINSRLQLFDWEGDDAGNYQLVPLCSHAGHVLALYVDTRGDFVLVGKFLLAHSVCSRAALI